MSSKEINWFSKKALAIYTATTATVMGLSLLYYGSDKVFGRVNSADYYSDERLILVSKKFQKELFPTLLMIQRKAKVGLNKLKKSRKLRLVNGIPFKMIENFKNKLIYENKLLDNRVEQVYHKILIGDKMEQKIYEASFEARKHEVPELSAIERQIQKDFEQVCMEEDYLRKVKIPHYLTPELVLKINKKIVIYRIELMIELSKRFVKLGKSTSIREKEFLSEFKEVMEKVDKFQEKTFKEIGLTKLRHHPLHYYKYSIKKYKENDGEGFKKSLNKNEICESTIISRIMQGKLTKVTVKRLQKQLKEFKRETNLVIKEEDEEDEDEDDIIDEQKNGRGKVYLNETFDKQKQINFGLLNYSSNGKELDSSYMTTTVMTN